ncbi:phage tail domain-containing protein [Lactococcus protaetiae]|uniref:Phage tail family protein n=1 Tax=Lactococcus protaetiae TaxID=2592653 RepID=A0A514ZA43_9LACT|nr:phage tail domain-containing protein [Lactococcus protaetiae]QDK71454.1 phage tail family protein [Lactococcus protaetiae]
MASLPNVEISYKNTLNQEIKMDRFGPFYLQSYEGFGSPDNEINSQKIFGRTGQRKTSSSLTYRDMTIGLAIKEATYESLKSKEHQVMAIINPELAGTLFIRVSENLYSIDAELLKGYEGSKDSSSSTSSSTLQFRALDPEWRDENVRNKSIPLSSNDNKMKFPLAITTDFAFATIAPGQIVKILNKGDFAVGFELTIQCNAEVKNPRIYNVITQEFFGWNGTFDAGTVIFLSTIHGEKKTWYQDDTDPEATNAMGIRMSGSSFFALDNIEPNNLVIQADVGEENILATISYTPLVIGV